MDGGRDPGRCKPSLGLDDDEADLLLAYEQWLTGTHVDGEASPVSSDILDFELHRRTGWTWQQLEQTPHLIRSRWLGMYAVRERVERDRRPPSPAQAAADRMDAARAIQQAQAEVAALEEAAP